MNNTDVHICSPIYWNTFNEPFTEQDAWSECVAGQNDAWDEWGHQIRVHFTSLAVESNVYWSVLESYFVDAQYENQILWIASGGNDRDDVSLPMPAIFPSVLAVGGLTGAGVRYENPPSYDLLYAPARDQVVSWNRADGGWPYTKTVSGTSAATAIVAGVALLLWDRNPFLFRNDIVY